MQGSMKNWIEFFRNGTIADVEIESLERVYNLLCSFYSHSYVSPNAIYSILNQDLAKYYRVVKALEEVGIIDFTPECPFCQTPTEMSAVLNRFMECPACGREYDLLDLDESILLLIEGKDVSILSERSYELNALILSRQALHRNRLYYLLCDIENSEGQQKTDRIVYNSLIRRLWINYWPEALMECQRVYLPLMAKGDACIIAFLDLSDAVQVLEKLSIALKNETFRITAHLDEIPFDPDDATGFVRGLDNKWDFNSPAATLFHRRVSGIKPQTWSGCNTYSIKVCLLDGLASKSASIKQIASSWNFQEESYSFNTKHEQQLNGKILAFCL